jgi:hypothetical protein
MAQQPSGKLQLPLMILAFVSVAGFVWWLSANTQPTQFAVATEQSGDVDSGLVLSLEAFTETVAEMDGREVRLEGLRVASVMSAQTFWFELENGTPFLVQVPEGVSLERPVQVGDEVTLTGTIVAMSTDVLDRWEAQGVIGDPVARQMAEFAISFLAVRSVAFDAPEGEASEG